MMIMINVRTSSANIARSCSKIVNCAKPSLHPITFVLLGKALSQQTVMIVQQEDSIAVQKDLCSAYVHTL